MLSDHRRARLHTDRTENMAMDFSDLDFLAMDDNDDLLLTQVCEKIESEIAVMDGEALSNLSLTQTVREYNIRDDMLMKDEPMDIACIMDPPTVHGTFDVLPSGGIQRFATPFSDVEVNELINAQENANTKKNTTWSVRVFESWRYYRNGLGQGYIVPLKEMTAEQMNHYLGRFILETRKKDGNPYPPRSLYLISCGLLRHLRDEKVYDKNFMDTKNLEFTEFRRVLDARMKELLKQGFGTKVKQAQPILPEDESKLWENGVFGDKTAETLQCTVFFYACKLFGL